VAGNRRDQGTVHGETEVAHLHTYVAASQEDSQSSPHILGSRTAPPSSVAGFPSEYQLDEAARTSWMLRSSVIDTKHNRTRCNA
jgi:hypothetical protein